MVLRSLCLRVSARDSLYVSDQVSRQIDGGLNRPLQVKHENVLHVQIFQRFQLVPGRGSDATQVLSNGCDLRQKNVVINHTLVAFTIL